jgi:hypothetical protein
MASSVSKILDLIDILFFVSGKSMSKSSTAIRRSLCISFSSLCHAVVVIIAPLTPTNPPFGYLTLANLQPVQCAGSRCMVERRLYSLFSQSCLQDNCSWSIGFNFQDSCKTECCSLCSHTPPPNHPIFIFLLHIQTATGVANQNRFGGSFNALVR